jgi:DNA-binding transcriptional LysR family regulator
MTPGFSLRQLSYLVAIADHGTMTAAAAVCHVSQAAVSVGIIDLERQLGAKLLARHRGHGVTLTEVGTEVVRDARQLLDLAADLQSRARTHGRGLAGRLRLGCYTTLAPFYLPHLRDAFTEKFPDMEVDVTEGGQEDLQRMLRDGECEVALTYDTGLGSALPRRVVRVFNPYFLLSANHPLADRPTLSIRDLADYDLIVYGVPPSPENARKMIEDAGLDTRIAHMSSNIEVVRSLVARGTGYTTLVQRWPSNVSLEGLPLVCKPVTPPAPEYRVVVAWSDTARLSRRAEEFIQFSERMASWTPGREGATAPLRP